jgi:hypothetical protein
MTYLKENAMVLKKVQYDLYNIVLISGFGIDDISILLSCLEVIPKKNTDFLFPTSDNVHTFYVLLPWLNTF